MKSRLIVVTFFALAVASCDQFVLPRERQITMSTTATETTVRLNSVEYRLVGLTSQLQVNHEDGRFTVEAPARDDKPEAPRLKVTIEDQSLTVNGREITTLKRGDQVEIQRNGSVAINGPGL